ncbi:unnamed protein product [Clonostachys rosea f. rosea IK726]|uniref:Carboxypeptidase n=3 Tax=Bionectria ochroleuca TaxID=29856 RepID=A0A0B7JZ58_BIOOC|nr:unnamed protein product [Clonostachys rosea f. rosea IK726]
MALRWMAAGMRQWPALLLLGAWQSAVAVAEKSASDYYVHNLPGLPSHPQPVNMHAGHIEVTPEHNGNLFFWHFENRHIADRQRTVIWFNGGPGCSSEDGALMEVGPYRLKDDSTLVYSNGSWNEYANLLFIDNPVGVGYSYVDTDSYIHELGTMADNIVVFLEKFFKIFPHYETNDIYLAGESYAGQYIPYIARAILDRNKKNPNKRWGLQGFMIGNAYISPTYQYHAYLDFALDKGLVKRDSAIHEKLKGQVQKCDDAMKKDPGKVEYHDCEQILARMLGWLKNGNGDDACVNMYDIRLKDSFPSCGMNWPPDLVHIKPYLRKRAVLDALHVNDNGKEGWSECNRNVGKAFNTKNSKPSFHLLPGLLEEIRVLLFSGAEDLICSYYGTERLMNALEWGGLKGFQVDNEKTAPRQNWRFGGEDVGFWQEARNLTYVHFTGASHMVPFDHPQRSRDMLDRFMGVAVSRDQIDSHIDGKETPSIPATNPYNPSEEEHQKQVDDAKWQAYRRSGEVVLVIVAVAACGWGFFIWRERRKRASYQAVSGNDPSDSDLSRFRRKREHADLEASAFDESELDDLHLETPTADRYALADDDSDDEGKGKEKPAPRGEPGPSTRPTQS